MRTFKEFLNEAKNVTIDVDWDPDTRSEAGLIKNAKDSLGIIIKPKSNGTALITGKKEDLRKLLKHDAYFGYDDDEIEDLYPELN
jgi:hypothetical protein